MTSIKDKAPPSPYQEQPSRYYKPSGPPHDYENELKRTSSDFGPGQQYPYQGQVRQSNGNFPPQGYGNNPPGYGNGAPMKSQKELEQYYLRSQKFNGPYEPQQGAYPMPPYHQEYVGGERQYDNFSQYVRDRFPNHQQPQGRRPEGGRGFEDYYQPRGNFEHCRPGPYGREQFPGYPRDAHEYPRERGGPYGREQFPGYGHEQPRERFGPQGREQFPGYHQDIREYPRERFGGGERYYERQPERFGERYYDKYGGPQQPQNEVFGYRPQTGPRPTGPEEFRKALSPQRRQDGDRNQFETVKSLYMSPKGLPRNGRPEGKRRSLSPQASKHAEIPRQYQGRVGQTPDQPRRDQRGPPNDYPGQPRRDFGGYPPRENPGFPPRENFGYPPRELANSIHPPGQRPPLTQTRGAPFRQPPSQYIHEEGGRRM